VEIDMGGIRMMHTLVIEAITSRVDMKVRDMEGTMDTVGTVGGDGEGEELSAMRLIGVTDTYLVFCLFFRRMQSGSLLDLAAGVDEGRLGVSKFGQLLVLWSFGVPCVLNVCFLFFFFRISLVGANWSCQYRYRMLCSFGF
jgi:hypothetical protein